MNSCPRAGRSHHKPSVRRPSRFARILKQIVAKVLGDRIVVEQLAATMMLAVAAVENVQRTVVGCGAHVVHIVFHLHFDAVALVVFAALELLVAILFRQPLQRPFMLRPPIVLHATYDHRRPAALEPIDELLRRVVPHVDAFAVVLESGELFKAVRVALRRPSAFVAQFCAVVWKECACVLDVEFIGMES